MIVGYPDDDDNNKLIVNWTKQIQLKADKQTEIQLRADLYIHLPNSST